MKQTSSLTSRGKCLIPSLVPNQFDYKNLENEENLRLQHPLVNYDTHMQYMKDFLSTLKEVPIIANNAFDSLPQKDSAKSSLPSNNTEPVSSKL